MFISSTFRDMHRERDHLVRVVFPELKERCRTRHVHLVDVDLRWGVTEADAEGGKALDICLDEIDGCRPYFLGILGHRYGYVPEGQRHSITAQEVYHGVLHGSVPKQVVDLRKILEQPVEGHTLSSGEKDCLVRCYRWDADRRKFLLQEDAAPEDTDVIRSVFGRYSIYQKDRSFFFFRGETLSRQLAGTRTSDFFEPTPAGREKLESLKKEIVDAGLPHVDYADIEAFGQLVLSTLWSRIQAEAEQEPVEQTNWLEQEAELHALFMADRTRRFVGRRDLLDRMHGFCNRDEQTSLLVVTGSSGCGKSALMARFAEEASRHRPDWLILGHFVGASPSSTSLRQMLRRFCAQLTRSIGVDPEVPQDIRELLKLFPELLAKASEQRPVLILIDAVNQLEQSDHAHSMHWFPQVLPNNVRAVISTLAGDADDAMKQRRIKPQEETVGGLTAPEIRELAGRYLREIRHEFPTPEVEDDFYRKVKQGNPLYILIALEELRVFGTFEELGSRISRLPDTVPALFDQVLERIESDFDPALVRDCMSYIACGRHGMTAEELQTLLGAHAPQIEPHAEVPKLPDMLWSRLYRSLGAYLFERSGVIDFFHGQLKEAVGKRYLQEERHRKSAHHAIAEYLERRWREPYARALDELPHQQMKSRNWQALVETLCDLQFIELKCQAGMTFDLAGDYQLAQAATDREQGWPGRDRMGGFSRFVQEQAHVLSAQPGLTFQQAANQPDGTPPAAEAKRRFTSGAERRPWIRWVNKPKGRGACLMTLTAHADIWVRDLGRAVLASVTACAYSPDGRRIVSASSDQTLKVWDARTGEPVATLAGHSSTVTACAWSPDGRRILSASQDQTLRVWNPETGQVVATLAGHLQEVRDCAYSPDGTRVVSASSDHTLRIWDAQTGEPLATLAGHSDNVNACGYSPDGRRIVSASEDTTLKLWDARTGDVVGTLAGHSGNVFACAYLPDGRRIVSASQDKTLKVWDAETGVVVTTLAGSLFETWSRSPDGRRILAASSAIKVWDAETGGVVATLAEDWEHMDPRNAGLPACAYSPDGRQIASYDGRTVKIWDAETGNAMARLGEHSRDDPAVACAYSRDGRWIVSASRDKALTVWDAETMQTLLSFSLEGSGVTCMAIGPRRAIAVGDEGGRVYLLSLADSTVERARVTIAHVYRADRRQYDENPSATCQSCGCRFPPPQPVVDRILAIAGIVHLPYRLPDLGWDDLQLLSDCPHCHEPLRFNPFIVDNRARD